MPDPKTKEAIARPLGPFEEELTVRLRKAADALDEVVRLLLTNAHELNFTDMRVVAYLAEASSASVTEVSRALRVDRAWISRALQGLGARGLTYQERDPSDSRAVLAFLTERGRAIYDATMARVAKCNADILDGVDVGLAAKLIDQLQGNLTRVAALLRSKNNR